LSFAFSYFSLRCDEDETKLIFITAQEFQLFSACRQDHFRFERGTSAEAGLFKSLLDAIAHAKEPLPSRKQIGIVEFLVVIRKLREMQRNLALSVARNMLPHLVGGEYEYGRRKQRKRVDDRVYRRLSRTTLARFGGIGVEPVLQNIEVERRKLYGAE